MGGSPEIFFFFDFFFKLIFIRILNLHKLFIINPTKIGKKRRKSSESEKEKKNKFNKNIFFFLKLQKLKLKNKRN